jgi:serine/threonine protein kinase
MKAALSNAHRDLKLDNTLLSGRDPPVIKLCDFGFAKDWEGDVPLETRIGSAPEACPSFMPLSVVFFYDHRVQSDDPNLNNTDDLHDADKY